MSIELTHYIEKRILNLLSFSLELKNILPYSDENFVLSNQITRKIKMAEEVYEKAKEESRAKEFVYLMNQVKKETRETKYWIRILKKTNTKKSHKAIDNLEDESEELVRIFTRIVITRN